MWQHRSSPRQGGKVQSRGTRGSIRAHLSKEVRFEAVGHVVALEPTSTGRCDPKLLLTWQRVDARRAPCFDLELVCGGTRSSGYRQRPTDPPREKLRTCRWGQLELKIREGPSSTLRNIDTGGGPSGGEDVDGGPPGGADGRFDSGHHRS
jgi:hypothetical protein